MKHHNLELAQLATPAANPSAGYYFMYFKSDGKLYRKDSSGNESLCTHTDSALAFAIDGGGAVITTGVKGYLEVPYTGIITGWSVVADVSGSIVVDVWKDSYANFPPTVADTIAGTEKPTLSSAQKNQDLTLTTWTTAVTKGDWLAFNVDSVATVKWVIVQLRITKIS